MNGLIISGLFPAAVPADIAERIAYWDRLNDWAAPTFIALFIVGAVLMLIAVARRRSESAAGKLIGSRLFQCGSIMLLMLCALSKQTVIDGNRGFIDDKNRRYDKMVQDLERRTDKEEALRAQYLYMPTGNSLAFMTLGNPGLAADYLWLTSTQYVTGNLRRGHKFDMLKRFYTTILELDPHWIEVLLNGGKVLSALEPDRFAVEKFYAQAVVANPRDWQLPYAAGRLFVVPPMNLADQPQYSERAVDWLKASMQCKNFPQDKMMQDRTNNLISLLSVEAGYYEAADKMLFQQVTDSTGDYNLREIAAHDWMNVRSIRLAQLLTAMANGYKREEGVYAPDIPTILRNDPVQLKAFKLDAFGFEFEYNPATGKVESRGVNVRKALTVSSVILSLIDLFRNAHDERPPKTLEELRDWIHEYYSSPLHPPGHGMLEALGADLDPTRSPLGSWNYDPEAGIIVLPPWCNVTRLYQRTDEVLKMQPQSKPEDANDNVRHPHP